MIFVRLSVLFLLTWICPVMSLNIDISDQEHVPVGASSYSQDKVYIDPAFITLTNAGMFCYLGNGWQLVEAIQHDSEGIYILASDAWSTKWACPRCNYPNGMLSRRCANCNYAPVH